MLSRDPHPIIKFFLENILLNIGTYVFSGL